jgi:hypothetical protein
MQLTTHLCTSQPDDCSRRDLAVGVIGYGWLLCELKSPTTAERSSGAEASIRITPRAPRESVPVPPPARITAITEPVRTHGRPPIDGSLPRQSLCPTRRMGTTTHPACSRLDSCGVRRPGWRRAIAAGTEPAA